MMRWLYWWLFDVEIMSVAQAQKVQKVIPRAFVAALVGLLVILAGLVVVYGNTTWYVFAVAVAVCALFLLFWHHAQVSALVDQNPSRYLPDETKVFIWVKRLMYLVQFVWFLQALQVHQMWQRALWLAGLALVAGVWSWWQWRRLNQRLHIRYQ